MRIGRKSSLTAEAEDFIKANYKVMSGSQMARMLKIGHGIVTRFCLKNNLVIPREVSIRSRSDKMKGRTISTPEIDKRIHELYLVVPQKTLAKIVGRSDTFIKTRLIQLGLEVPRDLIEKRKIDSRIKKGNIPPNKGKKMNPEIYENVKHTFFPKGHTPKNTKYDGYVSVRIDSHGHPYAHIRLSRGKFDLLHRHIWRQEYGEIPKNTIITFKNGDSTDLRPENLEAITRQEHLFRNRYREYPEELRETARILINLKKAITNYEKQRLNSTEESHV